MVRIIISIFFLVTSFQSNSQIALFHAHNYTQPSLLLDQYPSATVAYSLRKINTSYSGFCIRVRRSSDNVEQDIGFLSSGHLDTTTLKSFIASNSAFVTKWYDQSGNSNDLLQATTADQPRIVLNGIIDRIGSFPAIYTDGVNSNMQSNSSLSIGTTISVFAASRLERNHGNYSRLLTFQTDQYMYVGTDASENIATFYGNGTWGAVTAQTTTTWLNTIRLVTTINTGTDNQFVNGSNTSNRTNAMGNVNLALRFGGLYLGTKDQMWLGKTYELVIYSGNKSTERSGIETNINTYYSIY